MSVSILPEASSQRNLPVGQSARRRAWEEMPAQHMQQSFGNTRQQRWRWTPPLHLRLKASAQKVQPHMSSESLNTAEVDIDEILESFRAGKQSSRLSGQAAAACTGPISAASSLLMEAPGSEHLHSSRARKESGGDLKPVSKAASSRKLTSSIPAWTRLKSSWQTAGKAKVSALGPTKDSPAWSSEYEDIDALLG